MLVEFEAIELTKIARFADPQDNRLHEPVEPAKHLHRRDVLEIPWTNRMLHRLEHRVLADTWLSGEYKGVIDLNFWLLPSLREPFDDMIGIVGKDHMHEINPPTSLVWIAQVNVRRPVQIEAAHAVSVDPATF
jgi:hypothetical protein